MKIMKSTYPPGANVRNLIRKYRSVLLVVLAYCLAIIPIVSLVNILETTGVDSVSNDYLRFTRLADRVLTKGYDWTYYFKDSFDNNVHSYAFLFLVRLGLAQITHLSVMVEIYVGLALMIVNLWLHFSLITHFLGTKSLLRFLILPLLSIFLFSYSQISAFSYGETALQMGFTHLGILVGLWVLLLHSQSVKTPWIMLLCGIVASFSGGAGVLAWPLFFLAILITDTGSLKKYITWLAGMIISAIPYLAFSIFSPFNSGSNSSYLFTINKVVTGLGLPLANRINYGIQEHPEAFLAGLLGLGLLLLNGLVLLFFRSKRRYQIAIPSLFFVTWGMLSSFQISLSRGFLAPWYTTNYMVFWIGLLGLCISLTQPDLVSPRKRSSIFQWDKIAKIAGYLGLSEIILLFLLTNLTYQDKSFYLYSRSPVSAACVRNYKIAPATCEGFVFQWGLGNPSFLPEMASILEKYGWSVFGPHQEFTLQGDTILGKVELLDQKSPSEPQWVSGANDEASSWTDYHHLNLLLFPGQSIQWQIDLPQNVDQAKLQMGLSLADKTTCHEQEVSIQFLTSSDSPPQTTQIPELCNSNPVNTYSENLLRYAGKHIVVIITNASNTSGGKAIRLQYPKVLLDLNHLGQKINSPPTSFHLLNTDLSP